jgi:hypothetical protein
MDPNQNTPKLREHVASAHEQLDSLRNRLAESNQRHPELEAAIQKLEQLLNLLTVQTGGTL